MSKPETYFLYTSKPKRLVCRIHRPTKKGIYYLLKPLRRRRGQHEYLKQITLVGFTSLPSGLKRDGTGLPSSGYLLLKNLSEKLGDFKLTIDGGAKTSLDGANVALNHEELRTLLRKTRTIKAERFRELSSTVQFFLHDEFPSVFEKPQIVSDTEYRPNTIADVLKRRETLSKLSKDDVEAVGQFFPEFIHKYGAVGSGKKRFILSDSKRATEVVYIQKVIGDFERRLKAKAHSEQSWQDFLRDYILLFNSNYATILEMENNFRLLNNSLKNLSIILFDELLNNLANFLSKLKND